MAQTKDDLQKTVLVRIEGRVQGVYFRAWTKANALDLALNGFVRNRRDGSVEALFSGVRENVDEMLARAHEGPDGARVTAIEIIQEGGASPAGFDILETR